HYIYFLPWKDQMVEEILENGGQVACVRANNNISLLLKCWSVVRYIRKHQIVLIHAHLPWAGIVARIAGKISGIPVVYTEHNKQERYHAITRIMNLFTMNWLSSIIAVSNDVDQSIKRHKPNLKVHSEIILNGVNTNHFRPGV